MEVVEDITVTVGKHTVVLRPPKSQAIRWEILMLASKAKPRACAAALAACWRSPDRPSPSYTQHRYDCGSFGGAVLDELLERGVPFSKVVEAGMVALDVIADGLVSAEAIEDAETFTAAEKAGSTG